MITEEQYQEAITEEKAAKEVINQYHKEKQQMFDERLKSGVPFTDEELFYSRRSLCYCGHGLAYPKGCGGFYYWDCSAILKGIADPKIRHTAQLPFVTYDIKGERDNETTRGVFAPREPVANT